MTCGARRGLTAQWPSLNHVVDLTSCVFLYACDFFSVTYTQKNSAPIRGLLHYYCYKGVTCTCVLTPCHFSLCGSRPLCVVGRGNSGPIQRHTHLLVPVFHRLSVSGKATRSTSRCLHLISHFSIVRRAYCMELITSDSGVNSTPSSSRLIIMWMMWLRCAGALTTHVMSGACEHACTADILS